MAPNHKMTQHCVHVVLLYHVTNKNHYISSTRVPMATKLDRMETYFERLLTISHFTLCTWFCKVTWQKKFLFMSLLQDGLLPKITHDLSIMRPCEIRGRHRLLVLVLSLFLLLDRILDGLAKFIFHYLSNCCFERVWPGFQLIIWYAVCLQLMSFRN